VVVAVVVGEVVVGAAAVVEAEGVEVGKNLEVFEGEGAVVVVGDVLGANTSDVMVEVGDTMVEVVAEVTLVGVEAVGTVLTVRCIRSLLFGAGIALQMMTRQPVCSTAARTPPVSAPVGQCRISCQTLDSQLAKLFGSAAVRDVTVVWLHSARFTI
jgi:hypothetical protein